MAIARTANGLIVERRDGVDIGSVPAHKAEALGWKELVEVGEGPTQSINETETTITLTRSTPSPTTVALLERAAVKRRAVEIGGITVSGVPVYTDPESQAKLHAARTAAKEDAQYTVKWKGAGGTFFSLNATQIIAIADAVRGHVQACFDAEEAVAAKINNSTYTTNAQVDGASEWPTV